MSWRGPTRSANASLTHTTGLVCGTSDVGMRYVYDILYCTCVGESDENARETEAVKLCQTGDRHGQDSPHRVCCIRASVRDAHRCDALIS